VTVTLDTSGSFSVVLIATDNADARPTNFTYTVTEVLADVSTRTYYIAIPQASGTIDLADIAPAASAPGDFVLVTGPAGKTILSCPQLVRRHERGLLARLRGVDDLRTEGVRRLAVGSRAG
jgi:hypothetical protein